MEYQFLPEMESLKEKLGGFGLRSDSCTFVLESEFRVSYLGFCMNTREGVEGIRAAVEEIKKTASHECCRNTTQTNCIKISTKGLCLMERKREKDTLLTFIPLRNISYGFINEKDNNVFAFNHHVSKNHVECHAVVCESALKAREINEALYASFRTDHFETLRKEREKMRQCLQSDAIRELKDRKPNMN